MTARPVPAAAAAARLVDERAPAFALWTNGVAPEGWATEVRWRVAVGHGDRRLVGGTFERRGAP